MADLGTVSKSPQAKTVMMFQEGRRVSGQISCLPYKRTHRSESKMLQAVQKHFGSWELRGTENKPVSELGGQRDALRAHTLCQCRYLAV